MDQNKAPSAHSTLLRKPNNNPALTLSPPTCEKPTKNDFLGSGLPSYYFNQNFGTPSIATGLASESTVNESDLQPFLPSDGSTPRPSVAATLSHLKHQLQYSDLSLSQLCGEFESGEKAAEKIARQEKSWLRERGEIGAGASIGFDFSNLEVGNLTDFFRKKSELAEVVFKASPEKDAPVGLIDGTLDYSGLDTTAKIYELLRGKRGTANVLGDISNICEKSASTVSSLDCLTGGKLPIETSQPELVWGCVQVGKKATLTFIIRNKSNNKIHFQITSSNACFRVTTQDNSDATSTVTVLLYPAELRRFNVAFMPLKIGGYMERLTFTPKSDELKSQQTKHQTLMLYGYGGHSYVEILGVSKDSNLKMWLSLGKFDNQPNLTQQFCLSNMGTLPAFVYATFVPKLLFGYSTIEIHPAKLIILPNTKQSVTVKFVPSKHDVHQLLSQQVTEIGTVQLVLGEEALRGRIRKLTKTDPSIISNPLLTLLTQPFPNETVPFDTPSPSSAKNLLQYLVKKDVTVTIERDLNQTIVGSVQDETLFHSFAEGVTVLQKKCCVEPVSLILTPPIKSADCVLLTNNSSSPLRFETSVSMDGLLVVSPREGTVLADDTIVIKISYKAEEYCQNNNVSHVSVYVDEDVFDIAVKIVFLKGA